MSREFSKSGPMCQCGHFLGEHGNGICYAMVGDTHKHVCDCNSFQDEMNPLGPGHFWTGEELKEKGVAALAREDHRPISDRMRDGGVRLSDLVSCMFNDPVALVTTLNGMYFLDLGSAEPEMEEGDEIWDGSFEWDGMDHVLYVGTTGPSGQGPSKTMVLTDDTLIWLR